MKNALLALAVVIIGLLIGEYAARQVDWAGTRVLERNPEWYETDAAGFRQPPTPLGARVPELVRIAVLSGDETWGPGVETQYLWTVSLEKELGGRAQVMNRALLGANAAGSAATIASVMPEKPDIVLWAVSPAMLLESPDTMDPNPARWPAWWRLGTMLERALLSGRQAAMQSGNRNGRLAAAGGSPDSPGIRLLDGSLNLIGEMVISNGGRLVAFILPDFGQDASYSLLPVHDQMAATFRRWNVPVIDPVVSYRMQDTRMLRLDRFHFVPSNEGHEFLAKEAAKGLRGLGFAP